MNRQSLRIVIADDDTRTREYLWTSLVWLGHTVIAGARTGRELIEQCRELEPELVVTDIKMPDMDGIAAAREVCQNKLIPVILITGYEDPDYVERAAHELVLAYLVKPVRAQSLAPAIAIAMERFRQIQELRKEANDWKQALEERKIIERAKGLIMKRSGLDEPAAFRKLQQIASGKSRKLAEIAKAIVTAEEAYS